MAEAGRYGKTELVEFEGLQFRRKTFENEIRVLGERIGKRY